MRAVVTHLKVDAGSALALVRCLTATPSPAYPTRPAEWPGRRVLV